MYYAAPYVAYIFNLIKCTKNQQTNFRDCFAHKNLLLLLQLIIFFYYDQIRKCCPVTAKFREAIDK